VLSGHVLIEHGKSGEIYNIGGQNFRIRDVAEIVIKNVNPLAKIEFVKDRTPEFSYNVDFNKIQELGFKPDFELDTGVIDLSERLKTLKTLRTLKNLGR
jgi:nucleoside-diphosphate-sugar epimerase